MATALSLDSIREAADKKYAGLEVDLGDGDIVVLKNPLRVSKEAREKLEGLSAAEGEDSDPLEYFGEIYEALAGKEGAEKLLKALGDDIPLHMTLVSNLNTGTELGEASPSQD